VNVIAIEVPDPGRIASPLTIPEITNAEFDVLNPEIVAEAVPMFVKVRLDVIGWPVIPLPKLIEDTLATRFGWVEAATPDPLKGTTKVVAFVALNLRVVEKLPTLVGLNTI
jgi:hypothetical protein